MTVDIATLGIAVDTTQVKTAAIDLDKLASASDGVAASTNRLASAMPASQAAMQAATAATNNQGKASEYARINAEQLSIAQATLRDKIDSLGQTAGKSQADLLRMNAAALGMSTELDPLIAKIEAATAAQNAHGLSLDSSRSKMEVLRILHDAMIGSYERMGSSLFVLGNTTGATTQAFSALGAVGAVGIGTIAALAVGVLGLGVAMYQGAQEQKAFQNAMILTGGYVGTTRDQFNAMTQDVATNAGSRIGAARDVMMGLAQSGQFTGATLVAVGGAATRMAELTGKSADDIVSEFASMSKGVAKWADDANQKYHFLTLAQYEQIDALEKQGNKTQAMIVTGDLLSASLNQNREILGFFPFLLKSGADAWDTFWSAAKHIGQDDTIADKLGKNAAAIADLNLHIKESTGTMGAGGMRELNAELARLQSERVTLAAQGAADELAVKQKGDAALLAQEQIRIKNEADAIVHSHKTRDEQRDAEIKTITDNYNNQVKAYGAGSAKLVAALADEQEQIKRINDAYAVKTKTDDPTGIELQTQIKTDDAEIAAAKAKYANLQQMDDLYHQYGRMSDDAYFEQKKAHADAIAAAEISGYDKEIQALTAHDNDSEKEEARTQQQIDSIGAKRQAAEVARQAAEARYSVEADLRAQQMIDNSDAMSNKYISDLNKQANVLVEQANLHKKNSDAIDREIIALNEQAIAALKSNLIDQKSAGSNASANDIAQTQKFIVYLEQMNVQIERGSAAKEKFAQIQLNAQQWKDITTSAKSLETELTQSFGNIGTAIGGMTSALVDYGAAMDTLSAKKEVANANANSQAQKDQVNAKFQTDSAILQVKQYGDMAQAASQFFNKNAIGYKLMQDVEKVYRVAQMALAIESFVVQAAQLTGLTVTKATITAANMVLDKTQTTDSVANSGVRAVADTAAGAAKSFAQMGVFGFIGAAAIIAFMAALGVRAGGSGTAPPDPNSASQVQATQGTGTVLGDSTAKSDSIAKSLSLLTTDSNAMLPLTSQMASSLKNIENGIAGVANIISGNGNGVTSGTNFNVNTGTVSSTNISKNLASLTGLNSILGKVSSMLDNLWGKTSTSVTDSGLSIGGTVGQLTRGQGINQYANVQTDSSSWFGLSHNTSDSTLSGSAGDAINQQFALIFKGLQTTLESAGTALGKSSFDVGNAVSNFVIDTTKISLKGLTGTALTDAINAVISAAMDNVAKAAFPNLSGFQQVGEGYAQTVVRVASGIEQAGSALSAFGIKAISYTNIVNEQGDVGAEIVRQSIETVEMLKSGALSGIGQIVQSLQGTATDLAGVYSSLIAIRAQLVAVGAANTNLNQDMINGAGGIANFGTSLNDYLTKFFSASEQAASETAAVNKQLVALGITTLPTTLTGFRALIEGIDTSTQSGSKLYGQLIALSGAFAQATNDTASATAAATATQQTAVTNATNALTTAYNTQASALNSTINSMKAFAVTITAFRDGLSIGAASPLSPQDQYNAAKSQYEATQAAAQGGDTTAQGQLQGAATAFLNASKAYNASDEQYSVDFNEVKKGLTAMAAAASGQADTAQASLNALNASVSGLITINTSVLTVVQAIANLQIAINALAAAKNAANPTVPSAHGPNDIGAPPQVVNATTNAPPPTIIPWKASTIAANTNSVQQRATGGYTPAGLTLVGEEGPELVNFGSPSNISTASQTRQLLSNGDNAEQKTQTAHLRALVVLQQAANQALLQQLAKLNASSTAIQKKTKAPLPQKFGGK